MLSGHLQQMSAYRIQPMMVGELSIGIELIQQICELQSTMLRIPIQSDDPRLHMGVRVFPARRLRRLIICNAGQYDRRTVGEFRHKR